jgi:hypothetical protein
MASLIGFATGITIALVGYLLTQQQRRSARRDEQIEAVAALRYELQSNLEWMNDIVTSKIFLRDEAWAILKNKGYISYLPAPIPMDVIFTYEKIHLLNRRIKAAQTSDVSDVQDAKTEACKKIAGLIQVLDRHYPKIGKHFTG